MKDFEISFGSRTASMDLSMRGKVSDLIRNSSVTVKSNYRDGDRVYVFDNNGLVKPVGLPKRGSKGTVVSVLTPIGDRTSYDGDTFVKWDGESKISRISSEFIRTASKKVANLDDFVMMGSNASLQMWAAQESELVHKSSKDLWSVKLSEDGSFEVERLFDDNGSPLKV
jgi:hypothetical protein